MLKLFKGIIQKPTVFVLVFAMCCGIMAAYLPNSSVYALTSTEELEAKIKEIEAENARIEAEMAEISGDIADNKEYQQLYYEKLTATKAQLDYYNNLIYYKEEEISEKESAIASLDAEIQSTEADIVQKQTDIAKLQAQNDENLKKFGEMIRAMYISGDVDFASVMSQSKDFYDMLVRTKMLANISEQNVEFMNELNASIDTLNVKITELEQEKVTLEDKKVVLSDEKAKLVSQKEVLDSSRADEQQLNAAYAADYNTYSSIVSDLQGQQEDLGNERNANQAEVDAYEEQIKELIRQQQEGSDQEYDDGEWMWPVERQFHYITTYFGYDAWRGGNHSGIDIGNAGINGTNIYASKSGTVIVAKTSYTPGYSYGKYVVIDHGDGYSTLYGHCSDIFVTVGQQVSQGDTVASVGSTGWSTGPHLHFEVRLDGTAQDPFNYVTLPTD